MRESHYGIHVTHNDSDAIGCALVASLYYEDYNLEENTYFCNAGGNDASKKINELLDYIESNNQEYPELFLISDISIDEETAIRLENILKDDKSSLKIILGFDHHVSNTISENHPWFRVYNTDSYLLNYDPVSNKKITISACKFMFNRLFLKMYGRGNYDEETYNFVDIDEPDDNLKALYALSNDISRYDTWNWKTSKRSTISSIEDSSIKEDITQVLCRFYGPEDLYKTMLTNYYKSTDDNYLSYKDYIKSFFSDNEIKTYYVLKRKEERSKNSIVKRSKLITEGYNLVFGGIYRVAAFISNDEYSNSQAEYLYNLTDLIDIVMVIYPSSNSIGLRTNHQNIDVSLIAKKLGGGGHKSAAGVKFNNEDFFSRILSQYYMESSPLEDFLINNGIVLK